MDKKSFVFYVSWNEAIKEMNEQQVRNFINNLCNYAEGKDVVLNDLTERILWSQTQPLLDYNEGKRQKRIEGGKKGGLAKASNDKQAVAGYSIPSVEGRRMMDEGRRLKEDDEGGLLKDELLKLKIKIDNSGWDSLSTKEAGYWHSNKQLLK